MGYGSDAVFGVRVGGFGAGGVIVGAAYLVVGLAPGAGVALTAVAAR